MGYERQRLELFMDELGSSFSTPGGGAAAALSAAVAVALIEMVTRINEKKKSDPAVTRLRRRLQTLMTEDAKAFVKISTLYKKGEKGPAMQRSLKEGARCPEEICRLVSEASGHAAKQKEKTGRWLISDLKAAAVLLPAAFQAARFTVDVNLDGLSDAAYARAVRARLDGYEKKLRDNCARMLR